MSLTIVNLWSPVQLIFCCKPLHDHQQLNHFPHIAITLISISVLKFLTNKRQTAANGLMEKERSVRFIPMTTSSIWILFACVIGGNFHATNTFSFSSTNGENEAESKLQQLEGAI